MKVKLDQKLIDRGLTCPDRKKQVERCDTVVPGMYVLTAKTSEGKGTYYLRYNANGKTKHKKIARTTDMNLKDARDRARQLKLEISQGGDPQAEVKKKRNEITYGEFMELYLNYADNHLRPKTAKGYRQMFSTHLQDLKDCKINSITRRQIQELQLKLKSQGLENSTCNRVLALIKASYNVGTNILELIDTKNPAVGIPMFEEQGRERYLSQDELARLMPILIEDGGPIARITRFLLATGLRLNECLQCRWENIDIDNRIMVIKKSDTKGKKTSSVVLNSAGIAVLNECARVNDYPFANPHTGKPFVSIKKGFKNLMKKADLQDVTAHTLRHTAASIMINSGRSLYDVQKVLRHSSSQVTEKYAHLSPQSVMAASDTISDQLQRAAAGNK